MNTKDVLAFSLSLALISSLANADDPPRPRCSKARTAMARHLGQSAPPLLLELPEDPTWADTDVIHYRLDLDIDPSRRFLAGSNVMTVASLKDDLRSFRFRLDLRLQITEASIDGKVLSFSRPDSSTIDVTLDRAYTSNERFDIKIGYSGYPATGLFGGIFFSSEGGRPVVFTLSEPWYSYTWWPLKDDNRDKTTADLYFTVPDTLTVVSNGLLKDTESLSNNRKRFHWVTNYQTAPYLFCFSAARYNAYSETFHHASGTMPLNYFLFPSSDTPANRHICGLSPDMLEAFGHSFGLYPFIDEKHCFYQFSWGGGMEHQTAIGVGGFDEILFAHELAHQWWGDLVTCATWHDLWLNEGFATWAEAIWEENRPGGSRKAMLTQMSLERPNDVNGTVYVFDTSDDNRLFSDNFTYRKAAWVVHMLRFVLGDEDFFAFLTAYRERYAFKSVITSEFQNLAEEFYGASLNWFFDQWVYQPGAPTYRYSWREALIGSRRYAEIYIKQVQRDSYPTFTMPVDILINAGGNTKTERVFNDAKEEYFLLPVEGRLSQVTLDPEGWILAGNTLQTGFIEGPPKIINVSPLPGAVLREGSKDPISITFHKNVHALPYHFFLRGARVGEIPLEVIYEPNSFTATLTPVHPLSRDTFTLTVSDAVKDVASSQALDGEITYSDTFVKLPSGDGLPGGPAIFTYQTSGSVRRYFRRGVS